MKKFSLVCASMASLIAGATAVAAPISFVGDPGHVTDAVGDSANSSVGQADILGASVVLVGDQLRFRVQTAGALQTGENTHVFQFVMDTDQNIATGFAGVNSNNDDASLIGADFSLRLTYIDAAPGNSAAQLLLPPGFGVVQTYAITLYDDAYEAFVPLADLGNDDGLLNYKITSSRRTGSGVTTSVLDTASDVGQSVYTSVIPAPGAGVLLGIGGLVVVRRRGR